MYAIGRDQYRFDEGPIREPTIMELPHETDWNEVAITPGLAVIIVEVTYIQVLIAEIRRSTA